MFISIGDTKLFATAFGAKSAPALLAFGGWIGSWEDWIDPLSSLSEKWRVLAYDHRGSGVTRSPVASISFERLVDDVFVVMDAYGVESCVLTAMSMGSAVALGAALRHPERVKGLVLANPMDLRGLESTGQDRFLLALQHDYPRALEGFVQACIVEADCEHIKHWGRQILNRAEPAAALALYQLSKTLRLGPELPKITQPCLIIHGDKDQLASVESAQWLADSLPNAQLHVIAGVGHVPILTRPQAVVEAIEAFLHT